MSNDRDSKQAPVECHCGYDGCTGDRHARSEVVAEIVAMLRTGGERPTSVGKLYALELGDEIERRWGTGAIRG